MTAEKFLPPALTLSRHIADVSRCHTLRALVAAAPDRCVWGADLPHPDTEFMPNDGDLADMLPDWIPDEAKRKREPVDIPARLYDFR